MNRLLTLCTCIFVFAFLNAQDSVITNLKKSASNFFSSKDYSRALPIYRELLTLYPKDPYYQFNTAFCLLILNQNMEEAIYLFRLASIDKDTPLATFYLGRALHLHYDFEDAIKAYSRFLTLSKKKDINRLDVHRQIEMAKNGSDFIRNVKSITVKESKISPVYQLENAYTISTNGKIISKPKEFDNKYDLKVGYNSLIYLPAYTEINEYIYIAGYQQNGKNGKEIFRIKNINHQTWDIPELLSEVINTPFDEEYPFFDPRTFTLYFSSKGHSSMGGYDIFKSVYDWNSKTWSKHENLGFPINSPFDDYMLITDELSHTAQFASSRSTTQGMVMLYRVVLNNNSSDIKFLSVDDIREMSELPVVSKNPDNSIPQTGVPEAYVILTDTAETIREDAGFNKNTYNMLVAEALTLQIKADSIARIARDQRLLAKETPEDEARKQLVSDILKNERESKQIQREADEKFREAKKLKNIQDTLPESDTNLVLHAEINGIKVYQYSSPGNEIQDTHDISPGITPEPELTNRDMNAPVKENQFAILVKSPYSNGNPIPSLPEGITGLIYRVQLGVFSRPKEIDAFGGISPLYLEWLEQKNVYKYYAGCFYSSGSVSEIIDSVRKNGFPDAFIVAFLDGKPISTEKAKEIEFAGLKL